MGNNPLPSVTARQLYRRGSLLHSSSPSHQRSTYNPLPDVTARQLYRRGSLLHSSNPSPFTTTFSKLILNLINLMEMIEPYI